jgi:hypothetical protein
MGQRIEKHNDCREEKKILKRIEKHKYYEVKLTTLIQFFCSGYNSLLLNFKKKMMRTCLLYTLILFIAGCSNNVTTVVPDTYFEESGFRKTPDYNKTVEYCRILAAANEKIHYTEFGYSFLGKPLPLLIASASKKVCACSNRHKTIVLIQACIHAGEPDGKDAGLMLFRDIATKPEYEKLLENVTVLFIPVLNVDGHERFGPYNRINQNGPDSMGWRTNAQNLNLNRDFLNAESPEIQAFAKLCNEWEPDFFIDCHTTDGADYQYPITYSLETHGNMEEGLGNWQEKNYLPFIEKEMEEAGYPIFPYVMFRRWHDPRSGLYTYASPPMLSQGYMATRNCPGLLIETHMLKDYRTRVMATYYMLLKSIEFLAYNDDNNLKKLRINADIKNHTATAGNDSMNIDFSPGKDSVMVNFRGVEYTSEPSDLTGGVWFKYDTVKKTFTLPFYNQLQVTRKARIPACYIIPPEWKMIAGKLLLHGVKADVLKESQSFTVTFYRFSDVVLRSTSYEGRQRVEKYNMEEYTDTVVFPAGSFVIPCNQPLLRLIMQALEPRAPASYFSWGYFNAILEQKEYSETYVMEKMAREMLASDPVLKAEFENKMKDPAFAGNSWGIINWFYSKTPYWDTRFNVYPVAKVYPDQK